MVHNHADLWDGPSKSKYYIYLQGYANRLKSTDAESFITAVNVKKIFTNDFLREIQHVEKSVDIVFEKAKFALAFGVCQFIEFKFVIVSSVRYVEVL